jgi:hypothetical protein
VFFFFFFFEPNYSNFAVSLILRALEIQEKARERAKERI